MRKRIAEPRGHRRVVGVTLSDFRVIDAVLPKQHLIAREERRPIEQAAVPEQRHPALRLKNAGELAPCRDGIEPVEGLGGDHQIDAGVVERGRLRGAGDAAKVIVRREPRIRGLAHGLIGFDRDHRMARIEKEPRGDPRARADIGNLRAGCDPAGFMQEAHHFLRIAGPVLDVVGDAIGEALRGIGHERNLCRWERSSKLPEFAVARMTATCAMCDCDVCDVCGKMGRYVRTLSRNACPGSRSRSRGRQARSASAAEEAEHIPKKLAGQHNQLPQLIELLPAGKAREGFRHSGASKGR